LRKALSQGAITPPWVLARQVIGAIAFSVVGLCLAGAFLKNDHINCPHALMGQPCASCGLTRSLQKLTQGDIEGSLSAHPAGVWFAGWLIVLLLLRPLVFLLPSRGIITFDGFFLIGGWITLSLHFFY
jgi:hypothetical protein